MTSSYEAMFIIQPNLKEEDKKAVFEQLHNVVSKNEGEILSSGIWSEKRKLSYPIRKFQEGIYYLMTFKINPGAIVKLKQILKLNDNVIRTLILKKDK